MKIRNGFVTNSSSSSFIVAVKKENKQFPKEIEDKLLEWAKEEIFGDCKEISTLEELNAEIIDDYGYKNDTLEDVLSKSKSALKEYNEKKEILENGYTIYKKYIPCEGFNEHLDMYSNALKKLKQSDNFKDIDTEMYY